MNEASEGGPSALLFSIKCYLAAVLALYIALALHLQRPYWAVLTTYITAQAYSAAVRSKAVYRLVGTVAGLVAAVALVPALADTPELLCTALAAWMTATRRTHRQPRAGRRPTRISLSLTLGGGWQ